MHRVYLGSFLERWRPQGHALSFGCEQCHWEGYFPLRETLVQLPRLRVLNEYRLHSVKYQEYEGALHSLGLVFYRGDEVLETPILRGREAETDKELPYQSITIRGDKTVRGVAMRMDTKLQKIYGFRLSMTDGEQQESIEEVKCLDTELKGEWQQKDVPAGMQIVGLLTSAG